MARLKLRTLYMKFRIIPKVRMTRSHMFRLLDDFVSTGTVPPDIDMETADYAHSRGRRYEASHHYDNIDDITEMINAFKMAQDVRFEKPDR